MNFIDLFSGIGGFRLGMERAGHTCLGHVEIDKYANKSYEAIHRGGDLIGEDITKITDEKWREYRGRVDVICGGFPCQAFSIAGQQRGFEDTRGTLFYEILRAAKEIQPRYLLLENVKNLLSHDKGETFKTMLRALDELGYNAEWKVLNSKNFGVPQNRERVFIVGHLRGRSTKQVFFNRGESQELSSEQSKIKQIGNFIKTKRFGGNPQDGRVYSREGVSPTLNATGKTPSILTRNKVDKLGGHQEPMLLIENCVGSTQKNAAITDGTYAPTLTSAMGTGGGHTPMLLIKNATKQGYIEARPGNIIDLEYPGSKTRRGRVKTDYTHTIKVAGGDQVGVITEDLRIRKLTPRECWRLQGFPDWAFDRARELNSDTQLYKQAGNSVTVNVIEYLAKRLIDVEEEDSGKKEEN